MKTLTRLILPVALFTAALAATAAEPVRATATKPAPARGIEPDEIDARQRSQTPAPSPSRIATPARKPPVGTVPTPGKFAPAVDPNGQPQGYETADCSNAVKTITCCTSDGEGGSCNLFILLCEENGGTGKGDAGDAICVE